MRSVSDEEPETISREGFSSFLRLGGRDLPEVRLTLIDSLTQQLVPIGVLDEFQVAGVFVNWWDGIKYDLKTIMTNGWSPTLIPDALGQAIEQTEDLIGCLIGPPRGIFPEWRSERD